mgnify:CR=1 FL=1
MIKKKLIPLFIVLSMIISIGTALASSYIGNCNTYKFHYSSCHYVGKMSESHTVWFSSRDEAIDAGYIPCKVCRPWQLFVFMLKYIKIKGAFKWKKQSLLHLS